MECRLSVYFTVILCLIISNKLKAQTDTTVFFNWHGMPRAFDFRFQHDPSNGLSVSTSMKQWVRLVSLLSNFAELDQQYDSLTNSNSLIDSLVDIQSYQYRNVISLYDKRIEDYAILNNELTRVNQKLNEDLEDCISFGKKQNLAQRRKNIRYSLACLSFGVLAGICVSR